MGKPPKAQPWMIFVGAVALALALQNILPWGLPDWSWLGPLGWGLFAFGVLLAVGSIVQLQTAFRTGGVWDPDALVTGGLLKLSRNPFYLGVALALAGVGLARGRVWLILAALLVVLLLNLLVVPYEERMLEEKFGDAYRRYKKTVRRWL